MIVYESTGIYINIDTTSKRVSTPCVKPKKCIFELVVNGGWRRREQDCVISFHFNS